MSSCPTGKEKKSYSYLHVCHLNRNVASFRVTSSFNCGNFTCSNWRLESLIGLIATFFFLEALSLILFRTYLSFSFSSLLVELELAWRLNGRHSNDKESRDFNRDNLTTCNYLYLFLSICLMQHCLPTRNSFQQLVNFAFQLYEKSAKLIGIEGEGEIPQKSRVRPFRKQSINK